MTYVVSDIHGNYRKYLKLLEKINFNDSDTLFVLGDVVDRGKQPIEILTDMMYRSNVIPILGNHEYMALESLRILSSEITQESILSLEQDFLISALNWIELGGQTTIDGFMKLSKESQNDLLDYLLEFSLYEEVTVKGQDYVLVHAGLSNFSPERKLKDYQLHKLIFESPEYFRTYFSNKILVTGHTPTRFIDDNSKPDFIFKANNHIAIDCGEGFGGKLGAMCFDTGEEFYV